MRRFEGAIYLLDYPSRLKASTPKAYFSGLDLWPFGLLWPFGHVIFYTHTVRALRGIFTGLSRLGFRKSNDIDPFLWWMPPQSLKSGDCRFCLLVFHMPRHPPALKGLSTLLLFSSVTLTQTFNNSQAQPLLGLAYYSLFSSSSRIMIFWILFLSCQSLGKDLSSSLSDKT